MTRHARFKMVISFTLIELLVVVAVIAILMAMLLPALTSAKETGRRTKCGGSLRQTYYALSAYASDYGGMMSAHCFAASEPDKYWDVQLLNQDYIKKPKTLGVGPYPWKLDYSKTMLWCPSGTQGELYNATPSFGMNVHVFPWNKDDWKNIYNQQSPSLLMWLCDWNGNRFSSDCLNKDAVDGIMYHHKNNGNVIFFDGHLRLAQFIPANGLWND